MTTLADAARIDSHTMRTMLQLAGWVRSFEDHQILVMTRTTLSGKQKKVIHK